jgi:hypothetical protein
VKYAEQEEGVASWGNAVPNTMARTPPHDLRACATALDSPENLAYCTSGMESGLVRVVKQLTFSSAFAAHKCECDEDRAAEFALQWSLYESLQSVGFALAVCKEFPAWMRLQSSRPSRRNKQQAADDKLWKPRL